MKSLAFLIVLAASALARAADPVVIFDGSSLDGWKQAGPGKFELADGSATATGGMGLLWYAKQPYGNFALDVQYKVAKRDDNSGVFVRFPDPGNDPWVAVNQGHEIQICDTEKGNRTGAIYNFQDCTAVTSKPVGQWNDMTIRVVGHTYVVTLNGKEVNRYVSLRGTTGYVGLQNHFGAVAFRKVTVTDLGDDAAALTAGPPTAVEHPAPGLVGRYFSDVTNFHQLDDVGSRKVFFSRVDPAINFAAVGGDFYGTRLSDNFGVVWAGSVHVDAPGNYLFDLPSDDGSRVTIGTKVVVDNTFGNVPMKDRYGEMFFPAAGDYPVRVDFHQVGGEAGVVLKWRPPGATEFSPVTGLVHPKAAEDVNWDKADWALYAQDHVAWMRKHGKPYQKMDYGPFLAGSFSAPQPPGNVTDKGVIISLDKDHTTNVLFDTETLRYSAAWTGGYIDYNGVAYNGAHGTVPSIVGKQIFGTPVGPGWEVNGSFKDARPKGYGNFEGLHYRGLYRSGDQIILSYEVNGAGVLDKPTFVRFDDHSFSLDRVLSFDHITQPLTLRMMKMGAAYIVPMPPLPGIKTKVDDEGYFTMTVGPEVDPKKHYLVDMTFRDGALATIGIGFISSPESMADQSTAGGTRLWGDPIVTQGKLGTGTGPYVVDTITPPTQDQAPGESWLRFSGFDFFPDGKSAAVCTWNGDVWVVKGIDGDLSHLTWQRYATGLFQSLGLKIVNGDVYVLGRDQITRLHDTNGDGEADFYENFNNDCQVSSGFHEFQHDLQVDSHGNFYYAKGGPVNPGGRGFQDLTANAGCIMKVSPDGKHSEVYATGLRAPNGMSMGPHDEITVSDNQGTWTPACRISFVTKGSFLGTPSTSHLSPPPTNYGNPICWFPYVDGDYTQGDNSSGGAAWDTTDKWGPMNGHIIHLSYGTCSIFETMVENSDGYWQGGVCRLPLDFDSGIMRARFNPVDGQLYVCGLKGWQTRAAKDGCFQRVRYTGKPARMPTDLHVGPGEVVLKFSEPVDASIAADGDNWNVEQWNTIWSDAYGSDDMSVEDPKKKGHDQVDVDAIVVSDDKKTVTLKIAKLRPVMQMKIIMNIKSADGTPMKWEVDNTINNIPGMKPLGAKQPTDQ